MAAANKACPTLFLNGQLSGKLTGLAKVGLLC